MMPRAGAVGIGKSFGKMAALTEVDLEFHAGEVHAVLGENGAGKTTLVRVLCGMLKPDTGYLEVNGLKAVLGGRKDGAAQGIGIVQQQDGLIEELTGIDNYLIDHPKASRWLHRSRARREIIDAGNRLGLPVNPDVRVGALSIGERQRLEILIALIVGADIIIFDEPTAALLTSEVRLLIPIIRRLVEQGRSVVYITHKLDEVMKIADRVTVLRRGKAVKRFARSELDKSELIAAMVENIPRKIATHNPEPGEVVVEIEDVSVASSRQRRGLDGASLTVRRREIVGVAGVVGNGQEALAGLLRGLALPTRKRLLRLPSRVAFIPEDRARDGLAMNLSISDNMMVYRHRDPAFHLGARLDANSITKFVQEAVKRAGVSAPQGIEAPASSLSGGNQQKIVIAREFDRSPDLIVAHNPYRGLDVGAADAVRRSLLQARDLDSAVVLISPDLDDLFDIASRIVFLNDGRITGSVNPQSTTATALGALLGGASL